MILALPKTEERPAPTDLGHSENKLLKLSDWTTPHGGKLALRSDAIGITGTKDLSKLAVAVAPSQLTRGSSLKGECRCKGPWTGFILGDSEDAKLHLSIFSAGGRKKAIIEIFENNERHTRSSPPAIWEADTWLPFELSISDGSFHVSVGDLKLSSPIPAGIKRHHVGIGSMGSSEIEIRKLIVLSPRDKRLLLILRLRAFCSLRITSS